MPTYPGDDITGPAMTTTCRHAEWEWGRPRVSRCLVCRVDFTYLDASCSRHAGRQETLLTLAPSPARRDRSFVRPLPNRGWWADKKKPRRAPTHPAPRTPPGIRLLVPRISSSNQGFSLLASSPHTLPGKPSRFGRHLATHHLLGAASSLTSHCTGGHVSFCSKQSGLSRQGHSSIADQGTEALPNWETIRCR